MKRNFLTLALVGAVAMALAGSASSAIAACPAGFTNGGLLAGKYAVRIQGYQTDTGLCFGGSTCPDPTPVPIAGLGVLALDGACAITAGEFIYDDGGTLTSPTTINLGFGPIPAFSGTVTGADVGTYSFNANHSGTVTLFDAPSGNTFFFAVTAELGGAEFRGARMNPGDPLTIVGEKQKSGITIATFLSTVGLEFDWGTGFPSQSTGVGGGAIQTEVVEHLDPETNSILEGGGTIYFNVDNGYDSAFAPGIQMLPPGGGGLVCDFHESLISAPSTTDGTQNTDAALNPDYGCPLSPAHFENASVVWGSANQFAWVITTGSNAVATTGVSMGTAGKALATGTDHMLPSAATVHSTGALVTLTLTNDSAEPLDWSSITLSPALGGYAAITGGTCNPAGGHVAALTPLFPASSCTIILKNNGTPCTLTGAAHITGSATPGAGLGTLTVVANDHLISPGIQNATGSNFSVTCTH